MYDTVAEVMHTLPEGERVFGIAAFKNDIYVLRWKGREHVEVYDATTFALQRCLDVPNLRGYTNMALCPRYLCLYIGDNVGGCVHRVELKGTFTQWPVGGIYIPACLSVNAKSNVLVTCKAARRVKEFSTHGVSLREISLPDISNPWHAIQVAGSDDLIVCHGEQSSDTHRVCKVTQDGRIIQSVGARPGSRDGQFKVPCHLAVDNNNQFIVADQNNQRVTLLSSALNHVRYVVSRDQLKWRPNAVCLDMEQQRMYVADSEVVVEPLPVYSERHTLERVLCGRVLVLSIHQRQQQDTEPPQNPENSPSARVESSSSSSSSLSSSPSPSSSESTLNFFGDEFELSERLPEELLIPTFSSETGHEKPHD